MFVDQVLVVGGVEALLGGFHFYFALFINKTRLNIIDL